MGNAGSDASKQPSPRAYGNPGNRKAFADKYRVLKDARKSRIIAPSFTLDQQKNEPGFAQKS